MLGNDVIYIYKPYQLGLQILLPQVKHALVLEFLWLSRTIFCEERYPRKWVYVYDILNKAPQANTIFGILVAFLRYSFVKGGFFFLNDYLIFWTILYHREGEGYPWNSLNPGTSMTAYETSLRNFKSSRCLGIYRSSRMWTQTAQ